MNNLKTFYYIVSTDDGGVYLALNSEGMIVKVREGSRFDTSLVFKTSSEAQEFIEQHIEDKQHFKIQDVYLDTSFHQELKQ